MTQIAAALTRRSLLFAALTGPFWRLNPRAVVAARRSEGGTAFERVDEQLIAWSDRLDLGIE